MPKPINISTLIGSKSGRLTLICEGERIISRTSNTRAVICKCDCGNEIHIHLIAFTRGNTKSCGCSRRDSLVARNTTHGKVKTRAYKRWAWMISRDTGKTDRRLYFDRGIRVCERWLIFENFYDDMGECPEGLSLDRIDNNGNYEPANCRWASNHTQSRNRRSNVWVEFQGKRMCLTDAAHAAGITPNRLTQRIQAGMKGLFAPVDVTKRNKKYTERWTNGKNPIEHLKERMRQVPELETDEEIGFE